MSEEPTWERIIELQCMIIELQHKLFTSRAELMELKYPCWREKLDLGERSSTG